MFLSLGRAQVQRRYFSLPGIVFTSLLLAITITSAHAQGGIDYTGTGGKHRIQGRIYFPSGRRSDVSAVKVNLESTSSERLSVVADLNGGFIFNSIAPGSYTVTVDAGNDYEIARESIFVEGSPINSRSLSPGDVARADAARTFSVVITLMPKRGGDGNTVKPGVLNAALANLPKPAVELYEKALESVKAGNGEEAIKQLKAAISYYPEFNLALNELGVQYLKLGQADKAAEAFRAALKIKPDEFTPRLNYGIALLEKKDTAEAEAQFRQALKKNDASWAAHMYLGITLISLRNYSEAEKELLHALSIGGNNLTLPHYYLGGIYWRKGELKRAADELEKYLQLVPKAADAERLRATIKDLRSKQKG